MKRSRPTEARPAVAAVTSAAAAALTGCGVLVSNPAVIGRAGEPSVPLTPEQSRAQVVEVAREIVAQLDVPVTEAYFWRASCRDDGAPPLRGEVRIAYPRASSGAVSQTEIEAMIGRLGDTGWSVDPDFHSHSPALSRDHVVLIFQRQNPSIPVRNILVMGECRDVVPRDPGGEQVEPINVH